MRSGPLHLSSSWLVIVIVCLEVITEWPATVEAAFKPLILTNTQGGRSVCGDIHGPTKTTGMFPTRRLVSHRGKMNAARSNQALRMAGKSGGTMITSVESFSDLVLSQQTQPQEDGGVSPISDQKQQSVKLVFFSAPWCGPCRLSNPVVKDVMKQFQSQMDVYELCTDDLPEVAEMTGVVSIPTIQIYYDGEIRDTIVGCVAKNVLAASVTKVLEEVAASSS